MTNDRDAINDLETRVDRLLTRTEEALTAALPLAGILAAHGRDAAAKRIPEVARRLGLEAAVLLLDRLRESSADLDSSVGMDLGLAIIEAQGLALTTATMPGDLGACPQAAEGLRDQADSCALDSGAVEAIELWQDIYHLDPLADGTFACMAYPQLAEEAFLPVPGASHQTIRIRLVPEAAEAVPADTSRDFAHAADGGRASPRLRARIDTSPTDVPQMGLRVERKLRDDWLLLLQVTGDALISGVRAVYRPFHRDPVIRGLYTLPLASLNADDRIAIALNTPVTVDLIDGSRLVIDPAGAGPAGG